MIETTARVNDPDEECNQLSPAPTRVANAARRLADRVERLEFDFRGGRVNAIGDGGRENLAFLELFQLADSVKTTLAQLEDLF